jgi:hypothetical protein
LFINSEQFGSSLGGCLKTAFITIMFSIGTEAVTIAAADHYHRPGVGDFLYRPCDDASA